MNHRIRKQKLVETVLAELPKSYCEELAPDKIVDLWFMSPNQEGLRLTQPGCEALIAAGFEYFDFELSKKESPHGWYKVLLDLSKKVKCPFYLGSTKVATSIIGNRKTFIRIFDSKIAMLVSLYGSMFDYLDSVKVKSRKY